MQIFFLKPEKTRKKERTRMWNRIKVTKEKLSCKSIEPHREVVDKEELVLKVSAYY